MERDEMLPFTKLNHGFTRSRSLLERNLAYYKSSFAVGHLIETQGWETMLTCLDDYGRGLTTDEIIQTRLGMEAREFAAEVDERFLEQVRSAPIWKPATRRELLDSINRADQDPENPDLRAAMAQQWLMNGGLEEAVSEAMTVLEDNPEHALARFVLGHALLKQDEPFMAVDYLEPLLDDEEMLAQRPLGYLITRDLGMVYADLEENDLARQLLEDAIITYPSDAEPYGKLADIHERSGRLDEALETLDALTRNHETEYDGLLRLAAMGARAGRHDVAADALRRALWIRPYEIGTAIRLAYESQLGGNHRTAVVGMETACLLDPDDVEAHEELVLFCLEHGPLTTAQRYAARLMELDPTSATAKRALERL
jgi:tetratricopeptide (TPR) repeat protein